MPESARLATVGLAVTVISIVTSAVVSFAVAHYSANEALRLAQTQIRYTEQSTALLRVQALLTDIREYAYSNNCNTAGHPKCEPDHPLGAAGDQLIALHRDGLMAVGIADKELDDSLNSALFFCGSVSVRSRLR